MRKTALVLLLVGLAFWLTARHPNHLLVDMAGDSNGDAVPMLRLAVLLGADVNATDKNGFTAAQLALHRGNAGNLSFLLDHGAELTGVNPEGRFALYDAIMPDAKGPLPDEYLSDPGRRERIVRVLLQHGANANERDTRKTPILMWAAFLGQLDVVTDLVEHGADVNASNPATGDTPLHFAAGSSDNPSVVEFLIAHGANRAARNQDGKTPLDLLAISTSIKDESIRAAMTKALLQ
jgi:ankyrin repeat protein